MWFWWSPYYFGNSVSGSASYGLRVHQVFDPISYSLLDANGSWTPFSNMLKISLDQQGDGAFEWQNGQMNVTPPDGAGESMRFSIVLKDQIGTDYIRDVDEGTLILDFVDGKLADVEQTGQFASWAIPSTGTQGPLSFNTPTNIEFGTDWGAPRDVQFEFSGGTAPEPSSLVMLVVVVAGAGICAVRRHFAGLRNKL